MKQRIMLEGAALAAAWKQGGLDGLCGLYAAINALGVVLAPVRPLSSSEIDNLFEAGVNHLDRRQQLACAVTTGMGFGTQYKLTKTLAKEASRLTDTPLAVTRPTEHYKPFRRRDLLKALDQGLDEGAANIVCFANVLDHYSVVIGRSPTRFYLHDSSGRRWIPKNSLGPEREPFCAAGSQGLRQDACCSLRAAILTPAAPSLR